MVEATAAVIVVEATAAVIVVEATVAVIVVEATVVVIVVEATVVVILNLIAFTLINLLGQKVGKTEVMEILLKTLNMKVGGAGEKGECLMRVMLQTRRIKNPSLQEPSLI